MAPLALLAALSLVAVLEVPAGTPLAPALAAARPGDVVRLGPGHHAGPLGSPPAIRIEGAGAGLTRVVTSGHDPGVVARGPLALAGLALVAGPEACALKVLGGDARLDDVVLAGGSCGAFVDGGRLAARGVELRGNFGLLLAAGEVSLDGGSARGRTTGLAVNGGALEARRFAVTGPATDAAVSVGRGAARLEDVVVRAPGTTGLSVHHGGTVTAVRLIVAGATADGVFLGDCVQSYRATLRLEDATLAQCAGAAVEASGGDVTLRGVDATGGGAGCVILVNGASGRLEGNRCIGDGPGLVVAGSSTAVLVANRWRTTPPAFIDCAGGARVTIDRGEALVSPCRGGP